MTKRSQGRPGYVTFLCILLLAGAAAELAMFFVAEYGLVDEVANLLPKWVYLLEFVLSLVCGVFMLKGMNWARNLFYTGYLGLCLWSYIYAAVQQPLAIPYIAFRVAVLAAFCIALTMERANRFFTGRSTFFKRRPGGRRFSSRKYDY